MSPTPTTSFSSSIERRLRQSENREEEEPVEDPEEKAFDPEKESLDGIAATAPLSDGQSSEDTPHMLEIASEIVKLKEAKDDSSWGPEEQVSSSYTEESEVAVAVATAIGTTTAATATATASRTPREGPSKDSSVASSGMIRSNSYSDSTPSAARTPLMANKGILKSSNSSTNMSMSMGGKNSTADRVEGFRQSRRAASDPNIAEDKDTGPSDEESTFGSKWARPSQKQQAMMADSDPSMSLTPLANQRPLSKRTASSSSPRSLLGPGVALPAPPRPPPPPLTTSMSAIRRSDRSLASRNKEHRRYVRPLAPPAPLFPQTSNDKLPLHTDSSQPSSSSSSSSAADNKNNHTQTFLSPQGHFVKPPPPPPPPPPSSAMLHRHQQYQQQQTPLFHQPNPYHQHQQHTHLQPLNQQEQQLLLANFIHQYHLRGNNGNPNMPSPTIPQYSTGYPRIDTNAAPYRTQIQRRPRQHYGGQQRFIPQNSAFSTSPRPPSLASINVPPDNDDNDDNEDNDEEDKSSSMSPGSQLRRLKEASLGFHTGTNNSSKKRPFLSRDALKTDFQDDDDDDDDDDDETKSEDKKMPAKPTLPSADQERKPTRRRRVSSVFTQQEHISSRRVGPRADQVLRKFREEGDPTIEFDELIRPRKRSRAGHDEKRGTVIDNVNSASNVEVPDGKPVFVNGKFIFHNEKLNKNGNEHDSSESGGRYVGVSGRVGSRSKMSDDCSTLSRSWMSQSLERRRCARIYVVVIIVCLVPSIVAWVLLALQSRQSGNTTNVNANDDNDMNDFPSVPTSTTYVPTFSPSAGMGPTPEEMEPTGTTTPPTPTRTRTIAPSGLNRNFPPTMAPSLSRFISAETVPPTVRPSMEPPESPRLISIRSTLLRYVSEDTAAALSFGSSSSPQRLALRWLSDEDERDVAPSNDRAIVQRFALAVYYFATNGPSWSEQFNFLSGLHECEWHETTLFGSPSSVFGRSSNRGVTCSGYITARRRITEFEKVDSISMRKNNLSGSMPDELSLLTNLKVLHLSENHLIGSIPTTFSSNSLASLDLADNKLVGPIPEFLSHLPNLTDLNLASNSFSGPIPSSLSLLGNIDLNNNMLTGPIPLGVWKAEKLRLSRNFLEGALPNRLNDSSLKYIDVSHNNLAGPLNVGFVRDLVRHCDHLDLSSNLLEGELPPDLGFVKNLMVLDLSNNTFSGSIPSSLFINRQLEMLEYLNFGRNALVGSIPNFESQFGLYFLGLDNNALVGSLPTNLSSITTLEQVSLENNKLSGDINALCRLRKQNLKNFRSDCLGPNPEVECDCCDFCCNDNNECDSREILSLSDRLELITNVVRPTVANDRVFTDDTTPQYAALRWLALDDGAWIRVYQMERLRRRFVLAVIYLSTGGPTSWKKKFSFLSPLRECDWNDGVQMGVFCDSEENVVALSLGFNNATGMLPDEIGYLKQMTKLDVHSNRLSGPIPSTIMGLGALRDLRLQANDFSGDVRFVCSMSLTHISYQSGMACGGCCGVSCDSDGVCYSTLFSERWNKLKTFLSQFVVVRSFDRPFDDPLSPEYQALHWLTIDDEAQISETNQRQLIQRYVLAAVYYRDTGSAFWGKELNFLSAENECNWNNGIHGAFCSPFVKIINAIEMSDVGLKGPVARDIGLLSQTRILDLSKNFLTGSIPDSLRQLSVLSTLDLSGNFLRGKIPTFIFTFAYLTHCDLSQNNFTGQLHELTSAQSSPGDLDLSYLDLSSNRLSGPIGTDLGSVASLTHLDISNNLLNGRLPTELMALSKLEYLNLGHNRLVGTMPFEFDKLEKLKFLSLQNNKFNGLLPLRLMLVMGLTHLDLGDNNFTGELPQRITRLKNLTHLNLGRNQVSSTIPSLMGRLENLSVLDLGENNLYGTIPTELSTIAPLTHLDLSSNTLVGPIPKELGALTKLNEINLSSNILTSSLPDELGYLNSLKKLILARNAFTGVVPITYVRLRLLERFEIWNTNMVGDINFMCILNIPVVMSDCPEVACNCCGCRKN